MKIQIRLRWCAGWSESLLDAHVRRYILWQNSYLWLSYHFKGYRNVAYQRISNSKQYLLTASREHVYIMLTPINPTFIEQNWGLHGFTSFFLFSLKNIDCGYSLEPPCQGGSNGYPQSMFWAEIYKKVFLPENFQFLDVIFYIYI